MAGTASHPQTGFLLRSWRDSAAWIRAADILAVLVALSLPWSTSLVAIFIVVFLLSLIPAFDSKHFVKSLKRPVSLAPVALFAVATLGMFWASDISWTARLHGLAPVAKLLVIPFFIYQFERSGRGLWVAIAFLVSCIVVMLLSWLLSWLISVDPRVILAPNNYPGVPVKNSIAQSQEFAFCAFGALGAAAYFFQTRSKRLAMLMAALAAAFLANMMFVATSRTALVCIPVLLTVFAFVHLQRRGMLILIIVALAGVALAWSTSPYLRWRASAPVSEYQQYHDSNAVTSTGQRLEYWRKSIKFIEAAPLFGHGTGSTKTLFERDAIGQTGVSAEVIGNPHNQTLNVAVQWGLLGLIALYAIWIAHLKVFLSPSGLAAWIGLVAVVENFISSLFNSHLFDFTEGWIYVLAVGVAGGMVFRESAGR